MKRQCPEEFRDFPVGLRTALVMVREAMTEKSPSGEISGIKLYSTPVLSLRKSLDLYRYEFDVYRVEDWGT